MTYPRRSLVCLEQTPYYHCIARCVRRAWLWGIDEYAGKDYSHRKYWVVERLRELSSIFAIDVCAYAVMSNHYHAVLHVDANRARRWSPHEVIERWHRLFRLPQLVERYRSGEATVAERVAANVVIELWRSRLINVSWYMRCLNEQLARRANQEDECTGRFWEGRFKSQALLDEEGLLTAMAYVDLNPIRAGIARAPEDSEFTSIHQRIRSVQGVSDVGPHLMEFRDEGYSGNPLPYSCKEYLRLLDYTVQRLTREKRTCTPKELPPILRRLNIDGSIWRAIMRPSGNVFGRAIGKFEHLRAHAAVLGRRWIKGASLSRRLTPAP